MHHPSMAMATTASSSSTNVIAQTADLWLKIDQLHLNYLKADDSAAKLDIRKKLEGKTIPKLSFSNLHGLKCLF